ncbi:MAG: radical SAM protein [Micromonosporaceae bacterium]|nr:radical SAM protein [Micromonosporaceae bacterium]
MRWDHLKAAERGQPELPLGLTSAAVRTFDTPGFAGMIFYEIRAKSIINRVPGGSRVPFQWTINPYRGCTHACRYCMSGDTPILMADGRTRPLAQLQEGDSVYGTEREDTCRRYVVTTVLAHWSTVKPAFRVTLRDGTSLLASGDHRFLTDRGWKHTSARGTDQSQAPHLTSRNRLVGTGRFAQPPADTPDYRRGYLCGLMRGDGSIGTGPEEQAGDEDRLRLASADIEALDRARHYLAEWGVSTTEFTFQRARGNRRAVAEIRTSAEANVAAVKALITWPDLPSLDWRKGYLAGVFDAAGECRDYLRIDSADPAVIDLAAQALDRFGFEFIVSGPAKAGGSVRIRVLGGAREHLHFFHLTDPAITRKRSIAGRAAKGSGMLQVVAVEELNLDVPMYDITTGTGDFIADGVVSHNCFARKSHTYLDLDTGRDFDSRVVVKVNAPELLRRELAAPTWAGKHIAMGTNVDCYQRAEGRYRLMRPIIEALRDAGNPFSILTKGTLILRDLDLLRQAAETTTVGLAVSIGFLDDELWRSVEPGAPSPSRRLDVVRALADAGFECAVLMAPILPGLTDSPEQIDRAVAAIAAAGAGNVTPIPLHLRPGAREWYLNWLASAHPQLVEHYRRLYQGGSYAPGWYQREVTARVRVAARRHGLLRAASHRTSGVDPHATAPEEAASDEAPDTQLTLL